MYCEYAKAMWKGHKTLEARQNNSKWSAVKEGHIVTFSVLHRCAGHFDKNNPHCCPRIGCLEHCNFLADTLTLRILKVIF